jgi:hypothetical protein
VNGLTENETTPKPDPSRTAAELADLKSRYQETPQPYADILK